MRVSHFLLWLGAAAGALHAQSTVPTVTQAFATQTLAPGGAPLNLDLREYFGLPGVTGQVVQFDTVVGTFNVELRADAAPREVANFLNYVRSGRYNSSFFHRAASLDSSGAVSIVQGGGYLATSAGVSTIATDAPVPLEYSLPNERGTLAAARTSDPNSATSQWYVNTRDNSTILGPTNGGGYTVFGRVLGTGMTVVDAIAALPRVNASGGDPASPFQELPVRNYSTGSVGISNLVVVNTITPVALFPDSVTSGVFRFTAQSSAPSVAAASVSGSTLTITPAAAGTATITVQGSDVNGDSATTTFSVVVSNTAPAITAQPASRTIAAGNTVVLSAAATSADTFQWQRNGADVAGATNATLVISNATAAQAGSYTLVARNPNGTATSNAATLTVANVAATDVGRLINLSIRSAAGVGDQTLIVGFALGGAGTTGSAPLLLRGMGPSLAQFGLSNVLPDPVATLYRNGTSISSNNDWNGDAQIEARRRQVGAFAFTSNLDAALAVSPDATSYTMQITGNGGATAGTALAEIYDATPSGTYTATTPRLVNLSARTEVGTGDNVLIAGFVINGTTTKTVLIRAAGPALQRFGVTGVLANPKLQVAVAETGAVVAENDDWGGDPQIVALGNAVGAFPYYNGASTDAALLLTLPPGNYSAKVFGADGGTGVSLVEVYEVP